MTGPNFYHFHFVLTGSVSSWVVSSFVDCCYLMTGPNFYHFHFVLTGSVSLG